VLLIAWVFIQILGLDKEFCDWVLSEMGELSYLEATGGVSREMGELTVDSEIIS
jgi:hypothetical protein